LKHLTRIIALTPEDFFDTVLPEANGASNYASTLHEWNAAKRSRAISHLESCAWSDLKAFDIIYGKIPSGNDLQMGNSSVVRYILLLDAREDLRHFGNRGVAGIDGCTSTAVGAAHATSRPTTLISGDIGFFYDSNAFWNRYVSKQLKVIVINNGGGGIFRIIDGPNTTEALEDFFETSHERTAERMAKMYDLPYFCATDVASLHSGMEWLYASPVCSILEVMTPRIENAKVLKDYFNKIGEK